MSAPAPNRTPLRRTGAQAQEHQLSGHLGTCACGRRRCMWWACVSWSGALLRLPGRNSRLALTMGVPSVAARTMGAPSVAARVITGAATAQRRCKDSCGVTHPGTARRQGRREAAVRRGGREPTPARLCVGQGDRGESHGGRDGREQTARHGGARGGKRAKG